MIAWYSRERSSFSSFANSSRVIVFSLSADLDSGMKCLLLTPAEGILAFLVRTLDARAAPDDTGAGLCDAALSQIVEERLDVKKVQGFDGERDSGAGHFLGRRGRANLRRVCRRAARILSGDGDHVRGDAPGRGRAP